MRGRGTQPATESRYALTKGTFGTEPRRGESSPPPFGLELL